MEYVFGKRENIPALLPSLFAMFFENMSAILCDERSYEEQQSEWCHQVASAFSGNSRRLVLMKDGDKLAGFFWYYIKNGSLMMEEIQLGKEYQGKGVFRSFFRWLLRQLPEDIETVQAYAHHNNRKSQKILQYLGLSVSTGGAAEKYIHYHGKYALLADKINRKETVTMDNIFLTEPAEQYAEDIWRLRQEILDCPDEDQFAGCGNLGECASAQEWIDTVRRGSDPATCPADRVPSNIYLAIRESDGRIVGVADLRHHIDHPILGTWGGHTGYYVRPTERRKGYATEILRLNLEKCRKRGLKRVMITCNYDNVASEKVIIANGGVFEKEVPGNNTIIKRFWVEL